MVRGSFQDIKIIDAIGTNPIPKVAFIGQTGLWILNGSDYKLLKKYRFVTNENKRLWFGTGAKIITDTGASPISPAVSILTPRGKLSLNNRYIWKVTRQNKSGRVDKILINDLNFDKKEEYYYHGNDFVRQLDRTGKVIWKLENLLIYDINVLNYKEIKSKFLLVLDDQNNINFIDFHGNIRRKVKIQEKIYSFDIIEWLGETYLLSGYKKNCFFLFSLRGEKKFSYLLKNFPLYYSPTGVTVKFMKGKDKYLCVLARSRSATSLMLLSIFSPEWKLLYQEILKSSRGSCSIKRGNVEKLLIGNGTSELLEFSWH